MHKYLASEYKLNLEIVLEIFDFGTKVMLFMILFLQGVWNNDQKALILATTKTPYALDQVVGLDTFISFCWWLLLKLSEPSFAIAYNCESQAILWRFDKWIYIPLPDLKARQHMFKVLTIMTRTLLEV